MNPISRLLCLLPRTCAASAAGRVLVTAVAISACAIALVGAAPAGAVVASVGGESVGLQPRELASVNDGFVAGEFADAGDGPILPATDTYVVYWDPRNAYHGDWQTVINQFMQGMGADSGTLGTVFAVDGQYTDPANKHALYESSFHGAYTDTNAYPTTGNCEDPAPLHAGRAITCLTGQQMSEQLATFITQHSLPEGIEPASTKGVPPVYYLLTPPGVTICLSEDHCSDYPATPEEIEADEEKGEEPEAYEIYKQSFCSYHAAINPGEPKNGSAATVLYAVIPWVAGGEGDYHLAFADQTQAYDCQDGGFMWNNEKQATVKEHPEPNKAEEEARFAAEKKETEELTIAKEQFEKAVISEEQLEIDRAQIAAKRAEREAKEAEERAKREKTEEPREQEPSQAGRGEDGSFDHGLADLIVSQIGVEQQNMVTDPLLNGWQDSAGNESTDECRNFFSPTIAGSSTAVEFTNAGSLFNQTFPGSNAYLNDAYSLASASGYPGVPCITGVNLSAAFTAPDPVNSGELIGFDGMESDVTLDRGVKFGAGNVEEVAYPTFKWNFGDGSPEVTGEAPGAPSGNSPEDKPCAAPWEAPCAASAFHQYTYGGTYTVTLTVTDVAGNSTTVAHEITVEGPAKPEANKEEGQNVKGQESKGQSPSSSPSSTSPPPAQTPAPAPQAAAVIVPQSLRNVAHRGLVVRYSVNEQVAGHFEVLLSTALAKRLGIEGTLATGLPAGSAPETVIAKAILVTTKGGRSTVHIQFSKRTAQRLQRVRKVTLMLRLVVRNAAGKSPLTSTVLTTATLGR